MDDEVGLGFEEWVEVASIFHMLPETDQTRLLDLWGFTRNEFDDVDAHWTEILETELSSKRLERPKKYATACADVYGAGPAEAAKRLEALLERARPAYVAPPVPAVNPLDPDATMLPVPTAARALPFGRVRSPEFIADLARPPMPAPPPPPPPPTGDASDQTVLGPIGPNPDVTLPFAPPKKGTRS